ncbi:RNA-binding protein NOB1 [Mucuna pruriens]|uniref:RNA-binding protein NOB1 n=1 Tax=Mucuna pruriens TaxID=157652 RepID=A0A371FVA8_MUCPR|nr:RNA-binding protein NOB1 [Mucuna pruriens]
MEEAPTSVPATASCWSNVVKKQQPPPAPQHPERVLVEASESANAISVAVVDANAVIESGEKLHGLADKFISVPEVMEEIRDPVSRHKLSFLPFTIQTMEPSPESINKVIKFARVTGDLQTLSDVDIKLVALTYTLESQIHGTKHLRDVPPPVQMLNVKRLPEKDLPGWGSNVPNLQEWEALEQTEDASNSNSRILPLQDLNLNIVSQDDHSVDGSVERASEADSAVQEAGQKPRRYLPKKKEVNIIEGKTMVVDGVDASQGEVDDNADDWRPAVSRSTHRRFLRRKARREQYESMSSNQDQQELEGNVNGGVGEDASALNQPVHQRDEEHIEKVVSEGDQVVKENKDSESLYEVLQQMRLEEGSLEVLDEENKLSLSPEELQSDNASDGNATVVTKPCDSETDTVDGQSNHFEIASQTSEAADFSYADDDGSEQSWMVRSLSESSVACVTGDFAMQNVLLQMGLRLLAPGGTQIHQLHRWILKCHACNTVTAEIGRIFCPKCGNGGTLRKVAVTVNENGIVLAARRPRVTLRGTKFSLPLPQGGRDAVTKNLILREDQLPHRVLYPKTKKKANKQDDDFFTPDSVFSHHTDKKVSFQQPPVRKALSVFSGRRNPNDNHYSRSKHK